jgi:hypothetical protein
VANRPNIIDKNNDRTCLLTDVAISSDRNVIQKEAENKLKYKNLSTEIQRMWKIKCFVIPVITGTKGIVSKSLKKSGNTTRTTFNRFSTKTIVLAISHIKRKVTQSAT